MKWRNSLSERKPIHTPYAQKHLFILFHSHFAQAMLVALISALLAGIYPMLRLGKIAISSAVRQE